MKCQEVKEHLHAYADGELDAQLHAQVQTALIDCAECQEELAEIQAIQSLAREAFTSSVEEVDLSGMADAVMTRIQEEKETEAIEGVKVQRQGESGLWERITGLFGEIMRLERPVMAFATAAALIAILVAFYTTNMNENAPLAPQGTNLAHSKGNDKGTSDVNKQVGDTPSLRRAPELESIARRNTLILESHRIAGGRIFIEKNDEGDRPAVVWHVDTEPTEGTTTPAPAPSRNTIDETPN
jgi:hypothetical protein